MSSSKLTRQFWKWTSQARPHWKESPKEAAIIFIAFGITGSSSVAIVRPTLAAVGIKGSMVEGPWSYRIGSFVCVSPIYSLILLTVGTVAGRHRFFATMSKQILQRMRLPVPKCPR